MFDVLASTATIINPEVNQAINTTLNNLLQLVLLLVVSGIGMGVRTYLASMNSNWKRAIAQRVVAYAQQKIVGNAEKQKYVAEKLSKHFPRLKQDEIEDLIEEAVVNLKAQLTAPIVVNKK